MTLTVQELIIKLDEFADDDTIQVGSMGTLFEISNISKQDGTSNVVIEFEPHSDLVIDTSEDEESEDEEIATNLRGDEDESEDEESEGVPVVRIIARPDHLKVETISHGLITSVASIKLKDEE